MNILKISFSLIILFILLSGCNRINSTSPSNGNPTPRDFLKNKDADIFLLEGIVYSKADSVEWVSELDYTLGEQIGEITHQTEKASLFKNGSANKLPLGTKIYETNTPAYIVIFNGKEIPYLKMLEG